MKKSITGTIITAFIILFLFSAGCKKNRVYDERCSLTPDPGMCQAALPRYYYDKDEKKCKQFVWGGCGGVVPFNTLEECEACGCNK